MSRVQFSEFEIDLDLFRLSRNGTTVPLGPRPLDLLICLVENRHRVVGRDFLQDAIWDGAALSPATIPTCILEVRRALGDDSKSPRFIESHRARGYRFIGEVHKTTGAGSRNPSAIDELPFVGRRHEISALTQQARLVARTRRGRVAIVTGAPGIGKTRLLNETKLALGADYSALNIRATSIEGQPAFAPWHIALDQIRGTPGDSNETETLANDLEFAYGRASRDALGPENATRAKADRSRLFATWTDLIYTAARNKTTVLYIDDAHNLDEDSQTLLYWIAERIETAPLLMIIAMRPRALAMTKPGALCEVEALPFTTRATLSPLSAADIREVLDPLSTDIESLVSILFDRTGGNAFYLTHLVHHLDEIHDLGDDATDLRGISWNAGDIVSRQLRGFPAGTLEILRAASALGDRFPAETLAAVAEIPIADLPELAEPALDGWILKEHGESYEFNHSILRESIYATLTPSDRKSFHLKAAHLIRGNNNLNTTDAVATHLVNARPLSDAIDTIHACLAAATASARRYAFLKARHYLERALDVEDAAQVLDAASKLDIRINLAHAALYCGEREEARRLILDTASLARDLGDASNLARCALALAPDYLAIEVGVHDEILVSLLNESLDSVDKHDGLTRAKLLARLAQAQQWSNHPNGKSDVVKTATEIGASDDAPETQAAVLAAEVESHEGPLGAPFRIAILDRLAKIVATSPDLSSRLLVKTRIIAAALEVGDISRVAAENENVRRLAEEIGLSEYRWIAGSTDCMLSLLRGDLDAARMHLSRYRQIAGDHSGHNFNQTVAAQSVLLSIEQDQLSDAVGLLRVAADFGAATLTWRAALAWALVEFGDLRAGEAVASSFSEADILRLAQQPGGGVGIAGLSEVASIVGTGDRRELLLETLRPLIERFATAGYGIVYFGSFARYAGLLELAQGRTKPGIDLLSHALSSESKLGAASWESLTCADLLRAESRSGEASPTTSTCAQEIARRVSAMELARAARRITLATNPQVAFE